jgi:hypothetical protein
MFEWKRPDRLVGNLVLEFAALIIQELSNLRYRP